MKFGDLYFNEKKTTKSLKHFFLAFQYSKIQEKKKT